MLKHAVDENWISDLRRDILEFAGYVAHAKKNLYENKKREEISTLEIWVGDKNQDQKQKNVNRNCDNPCFWHTKRSR